MWGVIAIHCFVPTMACASSSAAPFLILKRCGRTAKSVSFFDPLQGAIMVRYRKLGYVALNVTNLQRSRDFYREFVGLEYVGARGDAELFRCDEEEPYSVA